MRRKSRMGACRVNCHHHTKSKTTKILITGAGGNLARALIPLLVEEGHEVRLMDFRPLELPHEFRQGDVRQCEEVRGGVFYGSALFLAALDWGSPSNVGSSTINNTAVSSNIWRAFYVKT